MQRFKALVQAQTTLLTILPLLLGTIMAAYHYHHVNLGETFLLMLSAICFHLAVNGHNQLSDYRRYQNSTTVQDSTNNIIKRFAISIPWAYSVLGILLLIFFDQRPVSRLLKRMAAIIARGIKFFDRLLLFWRSLSTTQNTFRRACLRFSNGVKYYLARSLYQYL